MRRTLGLLVPAALLGAGSLLAHEVAYRLAAPDADARRHLLAASGHGYLDQAALVVALLLALVPVALAALATGPGAGRRRAVAPGWSFALLPPIAFAVQEHLERLLATGRVPLETALAPTFRLGLVLQLPFALAALLAARLLLRASRAVARAVKLTTPRLVASAPPLSAAPLRVAAVATPLTGWASRGPPTASV